MNELLFLFRKVKALRSSVTLCAARRPPLSQNLEYLSNEYGSSRSQYHSKGYVWMYNGFSFIVFDRFPNRYWLEASQLKQIKYAKRKSFDAARQSRL